MPDPSDAARRAANAYAAMIERNGDTVNHPSHYQTSQGIECIDAIRAATAGMGGYEGYCLGNVIKYIWRANKKGGVDDLRKARWYLDAVIEEKDTPCQVK